MIGALSVVAKAQAERIRELETEVERLQARIDAIERLRAALLKRGLSPAPCDICGYNGPGYYQSDTHTCVTVCWPKDIAAALEALRNNPALQAALRGEGEK